MPYWCTLVLLAAALLAGGGGSPNPGSELAVHMVAGLCFLGWVLTSDRVKVSIRAVGLLAALAAATPILQLIPLPPSMWQALPGRDLMAESLDLIGQADSWRPVSVAPHATWAALLALGVPIMLSMMVASLRRDQRGHLLLVICGVAAVSVLLGVLQLVDGGLGWRLYPLSHETWMTGLFANRNANANFLLVASCAATALFLNRNKAVPRKSALLLLLALQAVLMLAIVMTASRAGIAMLAILALFQWALLRPAIAAINVRWVIWGLGALACVVIVMQAIWALGGRFQYIFGRFARTEDFRAELWRDSVSAMENFWPIGSGMGTFTQAFIPFERLDVVDASMPNRAHNDYLELMMESGLFGIAALSLFSCVLARLVLKHRGTPGNPRPLMILASFIFVIMAAHSVVDYPLRNLAGLSLMGLAIGIVLGYARQDGLPESEGKGIAAG